MRNQKPCAKGTLAARPLGVLPGDISSLKSSSQGSWVVVTSTTLEIDCLCSNPSSGMCLLCDLGQVT